MLKHALLGLAAASLTVPSTAVVAQTVPGPPTMEARPDHRPVLDEFWQMLLSGEEEAAFNAFFSYDGTLYASSESLATLASSAVKGREDYGAIQTCSMAGIEWQSDLVVEYSYYCQHETIVTRWTLTLMRLPKGWTGARIDFDDKIEEYFE